MRHTNARWAIFALGLAMIAMTAACGGNASGSLSPTGPSAGGTGTVITGKVNGMSAAITADSFAPRATGSLKVTISGTDISTTVDGTGQFTLTGVPPGDVTLQFSGPGVSATIKLSGISSGDQVHIEVTLNGSGMRLDSESRHRDGDANDNEIEGHITAITAATKTITVGTKTVVVPDTAKIHKGTTTLTFADLKVGQDVEVKGALNGTTFTATDVAVEDDNESEDDHDGNEVSGAVSGVTTGCPSITFMVGTVKVQTSSATQFDLACAQIANAVRVEVKGTFDANHVLMASRVERDN
jgi:hypothetical protein